ncbi:MAG TPA: hypothetical protein VJZ27_01140 [Aggregatilineales bacterium]|nr:hypothetical protein [Aggregatilineales bacterium]
MRACMGCFFGCLSGAVIVCVSLVVIGGSLYFYVRDRVPQPPIQDFTPDAVAAQQFENKVEQAQQIVQQTQQFNLSFTEDEVSSWLNLNAADVIESDVTLRNIQARFQDGQTSLYGEIDSGFGMVPVEVGITYAITPSGQVEVGIGSVNALGFGLPESTRSQITAEVQRIIDSQLASVAGGYFVTGINSFNGVLSIQGSTGS